MVNLHTKPYCLGPEEIAWEEAIATAYPKLRFGDYTSYGAEIKKAFLKNLGG